MPRHAPRVGGGSSVGPGSPYCLLHTPLGNACGESSRLHPLRVLLARRALCPGLRGHPGPSALSWTSLVGALARTRSAELAAAEVLDAPAFLSAFVQVAGYRVSQVLLRLFAPFSFAPKDRCVLGYLFISWSLLMKV